MARSAPMLWGLAAVVTAGALTGAPAPARAEFWVSELGELLERAPRIEIVEVTSVGPQGTRAVVRESVRGNAVGTSVTFGDFHQPALAAGDRALIVCDDSVCPRAIGRDRGGWFLLQATQPLDGAEVLPGLLERSSLRALADGRPAPELCVRAEVDLLDEQGPPPTIVARVDPADGQGRITGSMLRAATPVRLLTPHGLGPASGDGATLRLMGPGGAVAIAGGSLTRRAGCWHVEATPVQPLARSRASFAAALAGRSGEVTVARGTLDTRSAPGLPSGRHPVTVVIDRNGSLRVRSPILGADEPGIVSWETAVVRVMIPIAAGTTYPALSFSVPRRSGASQDGTGVAARLARHVRDGRRVTLPLTIYGDDGTGTYTHRPAGRATLRYVGEP